MGSFKKIALVTASAGLSGLAGFSWYKRDDIALIRMSRTAKVTVSIIWDYYTTLRNLEESNPEYPGFISKIHKRSANKLLDLACLNKGTYIKIGQHLGALDYLLPPEYVSTLKVLHSNSPESSLEDIEQVIKEDLNVANLDSLFTDFSVKPLGSASLAQVHKARLKSTGETVAVKVQHPRVQYQADTDVSIMEMGIKLAAYIFPSFTLMWLVDETKKHLPLELDFTTEAQNCKKVSDLFKTTEWVKIPRIFENLCTKRVLVMEFCEGGQINDVPYFNKNDIDANRVMKMLGRLYSEMIFMKGFVHCDPHPGNILVKVRTKAERLKIIEDVCKKENIWAWRYWLPSWCIGARTCSDIELVLLDHGLYVQLDKQFRYHYANLWQGLLNSDIKAIQKHSEALGVKDSYVLFSTMVTARSWDVIQNHGIDQVAISSEEDTVIREGVGEFLPDISKILSTIPSSMRMVFKTNDLVRGLETFHGTRSDASALLEMSRCCIIALHDYHKQESLYDTSSLSIIQQYIALRLKLASLTFYEWYLWYQTSNKKTLKHKKLRHIL